MKRYLYVLGAVAVLTFGYFSISAVGDTTLSLTLTTNPDLERGLFLHWTFDGSDVDRSSTTGAVLDRSGNNRTARYANQSVTSSVPPATTTVPGVLGQAFSLGPPKQGYVRASDNVDNGSLTAITMALWVRIDPSYTPTNTYAYLISDMNAGATVRTFLRYRFGKLDFFRRYTDSGLSVESQKTVVDISQDYTWHHVVATWDGGSASTSVELYLDGEQLTKLTSVDGVGSPADMSGQRFTVPGHSIRDGWKGDYDDVRIYDRALSAEEVKRLYELGATTRVAKTITTNPDLERGLVGHWTFDGPDVDLGSSTAEIKDRSGNGNTGDWRDHASTTVIGVLGQALQFDGVDDFVQGPVGEMKVVNDYTVSAWWKLTAADESSNSYRITSWDAGSGGNPLTIGVDNAGTESFGCGNETSIDGPIGIGYTGIDLVEEDRWYHTTCVYDSIAQTLTLYVDSTQRAQRTGVSGDNVYPSYGKQAFLVGDDPNQTEFEGIIDDVRIYDRALSADEVRRLYDLGATTRVQKTFNNRPNIDESLILHLAFDGNEVDLSRPSGEILDRSTRAYNGDWQNHSNTTDIGRVGQGLYFDGEDDLIEITKSAALWNRDNWSLTVWVKPGATTTPTTPARIFQRAGGTYGLFLGGTAPDNKYYCYTDTTDDGGQFRNGTGGEWTPGEWVHVGCRFGGGTNKVYINGELVATSNPQTGLVDDSASDSVYVGAGGSAAGEPFQGTLDELRLYGRALNDEEFRQIYEQGR